MKKKPKIAVILPYTMFGGVIYTLFQYHNPMNGGFDKHIRFIQCSPREFQTKDDMERINQHFYKEFTSEPDTLLIFGMHLTNTNIDNEVYDALDFNKSALAIDYTEFSWKTNKGKQFHSLDILNSSNFMPDILQTVLFYTNALRDDDDKMEKLYINRNRSELLNVAVAYERVIHTNDDVSKINTVFWTSKAEYHNKPEKFADKDKDASDLLMGFASRMKDGFNGYFRTLYEKSVGETGAKAFVFTNEAPRYVHTYKEGDKEKRILFVKAEERTPMDESAWIFLKQGYNAVLICSEKADWMYFYNNFLEPVDMEYMTTMFKFITKSDRRGTVRFDEETKNRILADFT